jgi:hypothetical protein
LATFDETAEGGSLLGGSVYHICPLRLDSGRITTDIGWIWLPCYLATDSGTPVALEFFDELDRHIPHIVRSQRDNQIRTYVYLRPWKDNVVNFFVRYMI